MLSSRGRLEKICTDIIFDMSIRPRLASGRGNAMLVAGSIPEACRLFEFFRNSGTPIADQCAIVTSYKRAAAEISGEETGMGDTERQYVHKVYDALLGAEDEEQYEREALKAFREKPAQMKLLIVVSRLLTGFDAPSATYIYIDKQMRDHSLFQAICRVNRLDGDDKDYGYIVDYKDLFKSIESAVGDYTTEAFDAFDQDDVAGLITGRAEKAAEDFETAREAWRALFEPVEPPKGDNEIYAYFSTLDDIPDPVPSDEKARRRQALYRLAGAFARTFAGIAEDPASAGVTDSDLYLYRKEVEEALNLREAVRLHSGDAIDLKLYEPAMRALIDTFIQADDAKTVSTLDDVSLIDLIDGTASSLEEGLPATLGRSRDNVAEAIANNVRRLIVEETPINPRFYETMSGLLTDLVRKRRDDAIDYAAYLARIADLIRQIKAGHGASYPSSIATSGRKALFDNLDKDEKLTIAVDAAIRNTAQAGWRANRMKTRMVARSLAEALGSDAEADRILEIVRAHDEY